MILLKVNKKDRIPIYRQIENQIKELIDKKSLGVGEVLPSTRKLAEKLGLNRSTIYKAYEELWALGYIESKPGSYSIVRNRSEVATLLSRSDEGCINWNSHSTHQGKGIYKLYKYYQPEYSEDKNFKIINLSRLDMDQRLFPVEGFRKSMNKVLKNVGPDLLSYGDKKGYYPLREYIAKRLQIHGISVTTDEILITNGSQNGIELVLKLFTNPGSSVFIEAPTYANVLPLLKYYQMKSIGIPMNKNGLDLQKLKKSFAKIKPAFVYTIPNFQNPTGITTDQAHREEFLSICEKYRVPIVEDGFEEEMKYFGKVPLPIKSMDKNHLVIYLGTFSKVLFPGIRIGWIAAEKDCIQRLVAIKRFCDLTSSGVLQAAVHEFCMQGFYDYHIKKMHRIYRKRMQVALKAMEDYLPKEKVAWYEPSGGYLIWVEMKNGLENDSDLNKVLQHYGVIVSPSEYYFEKSVKNKYFRISISMLDEKEIQGGIVRLGKALYTIL